MRLDMVKIDRFGDLRIEKQPFHPPKNIVKIPTMRHVTLEVPIVDRIKSNHGCKQAPIRFGEPFAGHKWIFF